MIPKFRAFWLKEKIMTNIYAIYFLEGGIKVEDGCCYSEFIKDGNIVLMQSTGLRDKNGVEIFEYSELDGAYEVIFKDLRYSLRHIQNNDIIDLYDYWSGKNGEIEVTREYTKV